MSRRASVLAVGVGLALVVGCAAIPIIGAWRCENAYAGHVWEGNEAVRLQFRATARTPKGVTVDTTGYPVNLAHVDAVVDETAACLGVTPRHCGLRVKITGSNMDGFPCGAQRCWGALQSPATAVVTPSLSALRHELIHILAQDPGHGDAFTRCGP